MFGPTTRKILIITQNQNKELSGLQVMSFDRMELLLKLIALQHGKTEKRMFQLLF